MKQMKRIFFSKKKNMLLSIVIGILLTAVLIAIPIGYEDALIYQGSERATGIVTDVYNSAINSWGMLM